MEERGVGRRGGDGGGQRGGEDGKRTLHDRSPVEFPNVQSKNVKSEDGHLWLTG
jgi:hypothetical protein